MRDKTKSRRKNTELSEQAVSPVGQDMSDGSALVSGASQESQESDGFFLGTESATISSSDLPGKNWLAEGTSAEGASEAAPEPSWAKVFKDMSIFEPATLRPLANLFRQRVSVALIKKQWQTMLPRRRRAFLKAHLRAVEGGPPKKRRRQQATDS
eukprot:RCo021446